LGDDFQTANVGEAWGAHDDLADLGRRAGSGEDRAHNGGKTDRGAKSGVMGVKNFAWFSLLSAARLGARYRRRFSKPLLTRSGGFIDGYLGFAPVVAETRRQRRIVRYWRKADRRGARLDSISQNL